MEGNTMIDNKKQIDPTLKSLFRISDLIKRNGMGEFFLVNKTAVAASTKSFSGLKVLHIGIEWDNFKGKALVITSKDLVAEEIRDPFNFVRGYIIKDKTTGIKVIFTAFFREGEMIWTPFSKPGKSLALPYEFLDPGEKVRVKNKWYRIPAPMEDYIAATFISESEYKKSDIFVYID